MEQKMLDDLAMDESVEHTLDALIVEAMKAVEQLQSWKRVEVSLSFAVRLVEFSAYEAVRESHDISATGLLMAAGRLEELKRQISAANSNVSPLRAPDF